MSNDPHLRRLMDGVSGIIGLAIPDDSATIGELGIDSRDLVALILICEEIYGSGIDMNNIDLEYDTSMRAIHVQLTCQMES